MDDAREKFEARRRLLSGKLVVSSVLQRKKVLAQLVYALLIPTPNCILQQEEVFIL